MSTAPHQAVLERIRAEYLEMPGMTLKLEQVQRLCGVERSVCKIVLDALVETKFLCDSGRRVEGVLHVTSMTGTVKRLVRDKRFGFIAAADGGQEYFFHSSACTETRFDDLQEGERVTFDVG
jgi:CspA family cold shock protein